MNELFEIGLLLDFYGQMLTDRQYQTMDLFYNYDYSLGEIAQELNISRQGVHDNIKRGKATLLRFEQKLRLVDKFDTQRKKASEILRILGCISTDTLPRETRKEIDKVREILKTISED